MTPASRSPLSRSPGRAAPAGPALPAAARVEGTRGRILVAGLTLFADRGFHATSIRDIAEAAGVKSASLYDHFPAKEAILAELALVGNEEHNRRVMSAVLDAGPSPADQLSAVVRAHVLAHTDFPMLAVVANYELHHLTPEAVAPALAVQARSAALLLEILERGAHDGSFDVPSHFAASRAIANMGVSVATWWPPDDGSVTAAELANAYVVLALRMVKAG